MRADKVIIDHDFKSLSKKGYQILHLWKSKNGKDADYKTLYDALVHHLVQRRDLAEEYCFE